jgi:hypothetical protein
MNSSSRLRALIAISVVSVFGVLVTMMPSAAIARVNLYGQRPLTSSVGRESCHQYCRPPSSFGRSRPQVIRVDSQRPFRWRDAGIGAGVGAGAMLIAFGLTGIFVRTRGRGAGRTVAPRI